MDVVQVLKAKDGADLERKMKDELSECATGFEYMPLKDFLKGGFLLGSWCGCETILKKEKDK
jgi:hypothetical protein